MSLGARSLRLLNPLVWRLPGRAARKLHVFALAEDGSRADLMQAAAATPSSERAALYVRHAADEARHAAAFASRSAELRRARGRPALPAPRADSEDLFRRLGEVDFLAFVHLGEGRGRRQFESYSAWFDSVGDARMRGLFDGILVDERRHEAYTGALLEELAGGPAPAAAALRRAWRWDAWRRWRRLGAGAAGGVYVVLMSTLYLATLPLALALPWLYPPARGWQEPP